MHQSLFVEYSELLFNYTNLSGYLRCCTNLKLGLQPSEAPPVVISGTCVEIEIAWCDFFALALCI